MNPSTTLVFKLSPTQGQALRAALNREGYQFRRIDHAFFQARGQEVVVSYYRSGKLVVQGAGREAFVARFLGDSAGAAPAVKSAKGKGLAADSVLPLAASLGSDEAGKGDSFGGLAVAAVGVAPESAEKLMASRVADSKRLDDELIRALAPWLRENFPCSERVLLPSEYNEAWLAHGRNVNRLLAELHHQCLEERLTAGGSRWELVVVDRFAANCPVTTLLRRDHPALRIEEMPRGEAHAAVAAASILARDAFLRQMESLRAQAAVDLPLGSGAPVAAAMRKLCALHPRDALGDYCKLHFKNIQHFIASS